MIVAAALVLGAFLLGLLAPWPLGRWASSAKDAAMELTWWLALATAVVVSAVFGAVLLVLGDRPHLGLRDCWAVLGHTHVHPADELLGAGLLGGLCLIAMRVARSVRRSVRAQRRAHQAHLSAARAAVLSDVDGVLWLDHHRPFAYSIAGRPGLVVASTALRRLPGLQAAAVLRHEREHLRGHHHGIAIAAKAIGEALPRIPLLAAMPVAARRLIELAADARTADHYGHSAVREALLQLGTEQDDMTARVRHLQTSHQRPARWLTRVAAWLTSTVAPAALGAATVAMVVFLAC